MVRAYFVISILACGLAYGVSTFAAESGSASEGSTCPYQKAKSARGETRFDRHGALGYHLHDLVKVSKDDNKGHQ